MTPAAKAEALIRRYFKACNDADRQGLLTASHPTPCITSRPDFPTRHGAAQKR